MNNTGSTPKDSSPLSIKELAIFLPIKIHITGALLQSGFEHLGILGKGLFWAVSLMQSMATLILLLVILGIYGIERAASRVKKASFSSTHIQSHHFCEDFV